MGYKLTVVGIGPGSPAYLLPVAKQAIDSARVLVGGSRALSTFGAHCPEVRNIDKDLEGVFRFIEKKLLGDDVVVMVSGDPGFYSLLAALRARFPAETIDVIPGLSSFQLAFARIREIWQDAVVLSLHGREAPGAALEYRLNKKLAILTDGSNNPARIAGRLLAGGWPPDSRVWLCSNLSYEDEQIRCSKLADTVNVAGFEHCVMVVTV